MATTNSTPVRRRSSDGLMDTADNLVDRLDELADILTSVEAEYVKVRTPQMEDEEFDNRQINQTPPNPHARPNNSFKRLKEGLESARALIACLKREKWRLSRRKQSVEMRMGELEDYKSHLKQDMSSLNETVDILSMRVVDLENELCEAQERQESLECENEQLAARLNVAEFNCREFESHKNDLQEELQNVRMLRTDSCLRQENEEIKSEKEILQEENHHLKEMIRQLEEESKPQSQDGGAFMGQTEKTPEEKDLTKGMEQLNMDTPTLV
ncbi:myosin-11-like isoform X1 [Pecten maximus]|uniref:myosin-11-like isoform X1 n=1 Tax=Pecten maximus TaxID=6579 RepID=UPI00145871D8|nr:myosin-11-like isoform X1 [Pecten maximus]XP_033736308.1 myosin-11-like isoform X1 [Pecten maximus]XP_033736309.1 myosin-11-like isoform X1 [Pecten maximus]